MTSPAFIKDVAQNDFAASVLARSVEVPVVVDFWAEWCAPCRMLGPILESEIGALGGRVELAKVDTDASPALAGQFGIQGIPAVKAFRDGQVVAEFVGAKPVAFIRKWLADLLPSPAAEGMARAEAALRAGQPDLAEAALRPLLDDPAVGDQARLMLGRVLVTSSRPDEARTVLEALDPRSPLADALPPLMRLLSFADDARAYGGIDAARAALDKNPRDTEARYALGSALAAAGDLTAALEQFLELVTRDRKFRADAGRLAMLAIFEQLGADSDVTRDFRRRLQIVL